MENCVRNFFVNSNLYGKWRATARKKNTINTNAVGEQFRTRIERSNRWIRTEKSLETESEKIRLKITMTMTTTTAAATTTLTRSERNESKRMKYRKSAHTHSTPLCVRYVCEWVSDWLTDWLNGREARARETRDSERGEKEVERERHSYSHTNSHKHARILVHSFYQPDECWTNNEFVFVLRFQNIHTQTVRFYYSLKQFRV